MSKDDLEKDLQQIISNSANQTMLLEKLISYIVRRDALVFNHAVKVGKAIQR